MRGYLERLIADLPQRSRAGESATRNKAADAQRLQEFLTRSNWDPEHIDLQRVSSLRQWATKGPGVLLSGISAIRKRGDYSVGVARQQIPGYGNVNAQVLVTLTYADTAFEWPVAASLFLPTQWLSPDRRNKARTPAEIGFLSIAEIALKQIDAWANELPMAGTVLAERALGEEREFVQGLRDRGRPFMVEQTVTKGEPIASGHWKGHAWWDRGHGSRIRETLRTNPADLEGDWLLYVRNTSQCSPRITRVFRVSNTVVENQAIELLAVIDAPGRIDNLCRINHGMANYKGRLWVGLHRHLALVRLAHAFRLRNTTLC